MGHLSVQGGQQRASNQETLSATNGRHVACPATRYDSGQVCQTGRKAIRMCDVLVASFVLPGIAWVFFGTA